MITIQGNVRVSEVGPSSRRPGETLFQFCKGRLCEMLHQGMDRAKVVLPPHARLPHHLPHVRRGMHRYGGLDTCGLTRTGRWKNPDSTDRYSTTWPAQRPSGQLVAGANDQVPPIERL